MKLLSTLLAAMLLPCMSYAQSASGVTVVNPSAASAASGNVIVVNGKKFFLMRNARRFNGTKNSPSALNVMHHPRPPTRPHHIAGRLSATAAGASPAPGDVLTAPANEPGAEKAAPAAGASDVLSIFAPEEKAAPSPAR